MFGRSSHTYGCGLGYDLGYLWPADASGSTTGQWKEWRTTAKRRGRQRPGDPAGGQAEGTDPAEAEAAEQAASDRSGSRPSPRKCRLVDVTR
jgi:hypothetical protein